jgi:hypothetical protein
VRKPPGASDSQQDHYKLLREISKDKEKNLILVTATPHSGIEESFLSLAGLQNSAFENYNTENNYLREVTTSRRSLYNFYFFSLLFNSFRFSISCVDIW